jgi:hypothetical protein
MDDDTPVLCTGSVINVAPPPHNQWKIAMQKIVSAPSRALAAHTHTTTSTPRDTGLKGGEEIPLTAARTYEKSF